MDCQSIKFSKHALTQMFARAISTDDVRLVIEKSIIIADYPDDNPYPSMLLLGFAGRRPIHVVLAFNHTEQECIVITAYEPDTKLWSEDFKTRRTL